MQSESHDFFVYITPNTLDVIIDIITQILCHHLWINIAQYVKEVRF